MNKNNIIIQNNRSGQPCFLAKDNNWYLVQSQLGQRYILHDQKEYELNEHDGKYYLVGDKCYCSLGQVTQYGNQQNTGNNRYPLNNQQYNQQNVQYNNQLEYVFRYFFFNRVNQHICIIFKTFLFLYIVFIQIKKQKIPGIIK